MGEIKEYWFNNIINPQSSKNLTLSATLIFFFNSGKAPEGNRLGTSYKKYNNPSFIIKSITGHHNNVSLEE